MLAGQALGRDEGKTAMIPVMFCCESYSLSEAERSFFAAADPFGFVVFKRNCADRAQLRALVAAMREAVGREVPVFIDQEGGRVARLGPPAWDPLPAMGVLGDLEARQEGAGEAAVRDHAMVTAWMLRDVGINGNFAPVVDLRLPETSSVIGDRAFSADPQIVAKLGRASISTYLAHGILPVIKHMPGHGRVKTDPHAEAAFVEAPREVLEQADFVPFRALADAPCAMNCHVIFQAIDPVDPVSLSAKMHLEIIRGTLGFQGLLFSDDLSMNALSQAPAARVLGALKAGADIALYTPGTRLGALAEMEEIAAAAPTISAEAQKRYDNATARLGHEGSDAACVAALERLRLAVASV